MKPALRDFLWMAVGAMMLLAAIVLVLHFREPQDPAAQLALKAKRVELVERMRLSVALASEAEKSAVMAITDEDSQSYADQARTATATVDQGRRELAQLLEPGGLKNEKDLLAQFSKAFAEIQRIDKDSTGVGGKEHQSQGVQSDVWPGFRGPQGNGCGIGLGSSQRALAPLPGTI